jgi:geranylgeranyl diphosphate synthase, type II
MPTKRQAFAITSREPPPELCEPQDECRAIQLALDARLPDVDVEPRGLHRAMREALRGGKRQRARLALRVGLSLGRSRDDVMPIACSIELLHAASLVHDDLPAFDDASMRRGRPSCHAAHGVPTAILCGDALLARAFVVLAESPHAAALLPLLGEAVGSERGIIGGQAMELDERPDLRAYHAAKTAALYRFAAQAPAVVAGRSSLGFAELGEAIGLFAQLGDDLLDVGADRKAALREGKTIGRDIALGRPNAALSYGADGARALAERVMFDIDSLAARIGPAGLEVAAWFRREVASAYAISR